MIAEKLRVGCDFLNLVFVYDEYADVLDEAGAQLQADIVMDALRNPTKTRPHGECFIGEMARQLVFKLTILCHLANLLNFSRFQIRANKTADGDPASLDRFIREFDAYTAAVVKEAGDHGSKRVRNIKDYIRLRQDTSGVGATLAIIEFGLKLPTDVIENPTVASLTADAIKLISLINVCISTIFPGAFVANTISMIQDLNSYLREESSGQGCHNIVTVVMHEFQLDHAGAMDWLEVYITEIVYRFLSNRDHLPSWGKDIDARLQVYIDGLGYWVRGNDCWSFEGHRYFGEKGLLIQKHRWVELQPPSAGYLGKRRQSLSSRH